MQALPAAQPAGDHDREQRRAQREHAGGPGDDGDARQREHALPRQGEDEDPERGVGDGDHSGALDQAEVVIDRRVPGERRQARRPGRAPSAGPARRTMALASAAASPTGTRAPSRPSWRISRGPLGQSVETTRVPAASASISTVGSPSQAEESTNSADAGHVGHGVVAEAGKRHVARPRPARAASASSAGRSSPSPRIISRAAPPAADLGEGPDQRGEVLLAGQPAHAEDDRRLSRGEPRVVRAPARPAPAAPA